MPVQGILFDSGDTLVRPLGGAWFPGHLFRDILEQHDAGDLAWEHLEAALAAGYRHLEANHVVMTVDEERQQFTDYYRLVLAELGLGAPSPVLLRALASAIVNDLNLELFSDVPAALQDLHASGLRLGIVSNSWPSLEPKYGLLGVREHFDAFVISAQLGCVKPDERMFRHGLAGLALDPEQVLFVDDWPEYVQAAIDLGMQGAVMDRHGTQESLDLPRATSMADVLALVC
jgi:putative hydrolase of the HAD superfamily